MNTVSWKGIYPAVLTPFHANDTIDYDTFKLNTDAQVEAGVDGIILGGSLGEASTLLNAEKIDLLVYAKEILLDKIPVIVNIAEQSTKEAIAVANASEANGADGLMVLPPMRYKADDREVVEYFKTIARNTSLPIMIYNNPVDYKIMISLEMLAELAEMDNIQSIKESTRDITNITRTFNRFGNRFKILGGVDTLSYESLCAGADGLVAGLVDAFPRETVAMYKLIKSGYHQEALNIYRWFMPLLELDIHPKLVQYIKLAAMQAGIGTEHVRAPRLVLEGQERKSILSIINDAIESRPELPDYLNLQPTENVQWA